jgi:hypothetical protein
MIECGSNHHGMSAQPVNVRGQRTSRTVAGRTGLPRLYHHHGSFRISQHSALLRKTRVSKANGRRRPALRPFQSLLEHAEELHAVTRQSMRRWTKSTHIAEYLLLQPRSVGLSGEYRSSDSARLPLAGRYLQAHCSVASAASSSVNASSSGERHRGGRACCFSQFARKGSCGRGLGRA